MIGRVTDCMFCLTCNIHNIIKQNELIMLHVKQLKSFVAFN